MTRILVADDHPLVRKGLREILSEALDDVEIGEAADCVQTMRQVRASPWDVVLLDISMPGPGGLEVLKDVKREYPKLPVLILSSHAEDQYAIRLLKAGAAGFLSKESATEDLVSAVVRVLRGGRYVSPSLAEQLAVALDVDANREPHEGLSDREFQVLRLIGSGRTVSQIADELAISVKTVSTYRTRLLEKMGMATNAELTRYAIERRLV